MKTITTKQAQDAYEEHTGQKIKLTRAPKHWGTAVFLDSTGRQAIAALYSDGRQFAWGLRGRTVPLHIPAPA